MNDENFHQRLKKAASLIGGQAELARQTGISSRSVNAYCSGKSDPSRERLVAMAMAAGVSVGWLAAGEGHMLPEQQQARIEIIEDPVITELKLWLNEMVGEDQDRIGWFRIELQERFQEFKKWREKNREALSPGDQAAG